MNQKSDFVPASVRTEPVQQRSTERITSLLDAAADLIDHNGIDGLTTSDVATRSGSSVGVVYRYFPNIQSLLRALASRNMEKFTARIFGAMSEEPEGWMAAMNAAIDAYADLLRTEPGFRALGFGDVIDKRFIQPDMSNNSVLAKEFTELFTRKYGLVPSDDLSLDLEIIIEISDALLHRAFLYERDGDERFITKLRGIVHEYMSPPRGGPPVIELRTPAEIEEMRAAGTFVASVLTATAEASVVGANLLDIDRLAHDMIRAAGAESCYIDYHPSFGASPFGKVICTSVNDAALHGLPHNYRLRDGDLVSLDFAASVDGWVADSALSFVVGTPRDEDLAVIDVTSRALEAGIRRRGRRQQDRRHLVGDRRGRPRGRLQGQHRLRRPQRRAAPCTATSTCRTTAGRGAASRFVLGSCSPSNRGS